MGALRAELKKAKAIDVRVSPVIILSVFHLERGGCPEIPKILIKVPTLTHVQLIHLLDC